MKKILPLFFCLLFISCENRTYTHYETPASINNIKLSLRIAQTPKEREKWLMYEKNMCESCGMLFIFPQVEFLSFWMKNTLIPLDMLFLDESYILVDFTEWMPPQKNNESIARYTSKIPAKYVLELPAGFIKKYNISLGDILKR